MNTYVALVKISDFDDIFRSSRPWIVSKSISEKAFEEGDFDFNELDPHIVYRNASLANPIFVKYRYEDKSSENEFTLDRIECVYGKDENTKNKVHANFPILRAEIYPDNVKKSRDEWLVKEEVRDALLGGEMIQERFFPDSPHIKTGKKQRDEIEEWIRHRQNGAILEAGKNSFISYVFEYQREKSCEDLVLQALSDIANCIKSAQGDSHPIVDDLRKLYRAFLTATDGSDKTRLSSDIICYLMCSQLDAEETIGSLLSLALFFHLKEAVLKDKEDLLNSLPIIVNDLKMRHKQATQEALWLLGIYMHASNLQEFNVTVNLRNMKAKGGSASFTMLKFPFAFNPKNCVPYDVCQEPSQKKKASVTTEISTPSQTVKDRVGLDVHPRAEAVISNIEDDEPTKESAKTPLKRPRKRRSSKKEKHESGANGQVELPLEVDGV